jgi:Ca-activated chloride channel family protein
MQDRWLTLLRSLLLMAAVSAGIATLATTPGEAQANKASREGTMYVSAVNREGEPVTGLGPEDFIIREDGVTREVLRVSRATDPIDLAILLDNSAGATAGVTFLREGLSNFVAKMSPGNRIALVGLADRPTIIVDYTEDTKRLSEAVGRLFPLPGSGMTLLDAIYETSQGLKKREGPRAVMVAVLTDSVEFTNRYEKDVVRALVQVNAQLHMVTIGVFRHRDDEHSIRERSFLIDSGPRESGGNRISLLAPHALNSSLQLVARELSEQYKVVYGRPESLIAPERAVVSSAKADVTMRGSRARGESGG